MYVKELLVENPTDHSLEVIWEPWGIDLTLPVGATFRFVGKGEKPGDFVMERDENTVIVYSWASSTGAIYNGDQVVLKLSVAVPDVPEGMDVRGFLGMVLGKPE